MPKSKPIHIMWYEHEGWCGVKGIQDFAFMASKNNLPTCKNCLKSPFSGEYFTSDKLEDCYNDLFDKWVDRFNISTDGITRKTAVMLLAQAKQQV